LLTLHTSHLPPPTRARPPAIVLGALSLIYTRSVRVDKTHLHDTPRRHNPLTPLTPTHTTMHETQACAPGQLPQPDRMRKRCLHPPVQWSLFCMSRPWRPSCRLWGGTRHCWELPRPSVRRRIGVEQPPTRRHTRYSCCSFQRSCTCRSSPSSLSGCNTLPGCKRPRTLL